MSSSSDTRSDVRDAPSAPLLRGRVLRSTAGVRIAPVTVAFAFDRDLAEPLPAVRAAAADAYRDGFEAGRREGEVTAIDHLRAEDQAQRERAIHLTSAIERAGQELARQLLAQDQDRSGAILSIAVALAEAVIGREVTSGTRVACEAVERAMSGAMAEPGASAFAHLNPDDAAMLGVGDLPANVTVVSDPSLRPGDCILRVADRSIDARLHTALQRAEAVLLDTVHEVEEVRL